MDKLLEQRPLLPPPPLQDVRLYSPGTLAAFTAICSLPIGFALYGLNVRARGHSALGRSMVAFGVALHLFIVVLSATGLLASRPFVLLGLFGALNVYRLESGPYARALARGASKAPWWPAALVISAVSLLLLALSLLPALVF